MVNWTKEQNEAIAVRNKNLLVAAAAGSGKTAVLVERIIQLIISDKVNIDQLLIVTFTHAAAGEMREKISKAIVVELEKCNENEEHLRRQLNMLNRANISTMHAFCSEVVRKYFYLIDIDPEFRIGDNGEISLIKLECLEDIIEQEYEKGDELFFSLVEMFGSSKDDTPLHQLVIQLYEFIQSQPYPLQWLQERIEDFAMNESSFQECSWIMAIKQQLQVNLFGASSLFAEALGICQQEGGPLSYRSALMDDLAIVDNLLKSLDTGMGKLYDEIQKVRHTRLPRISKDTELTLVNNCKLLRDKGKAILKDIQNTLFGRSPSQYLEDLHTIYPYMQYLYKLVSQFSETYQETKLEKGIMDFNDLEHYTLAILADDEASNEYRDKFAYIFVDEYQDSNLVQETILNYIKRECNLFLVGDVKQSIYRFRLADPSLFMDKYQSYQKHIQRNNQRIDLSMNFRSREKIIHGVNYIFKHIMSRQFGEVDYTREVYLYPGLPDVPMDNTEIEIILIDKTIVQDSLLNMSVNQEEMAESKNSPDSSDGVQNSDNQYEESTPNEFEEIAEMQAAEIEARFVAQRINEIVGTTIYDSVQEKYRPIQYRDIVVLMRATRGRASQFLETFIAEGIPSYADVNQGYFEALEVNIFINLLRIIDNKRQDLPLLSVMRSPIGEFSLEDLISIRMGSQARTFFEAIEQYIIEQTDELSLKLKSFITKLDSWKQEALFKHMDDFIWDLLIDTGFYYYSGAMPGGEQRQANLRILLNRARQFQLTSIRGLFQFIQFVDKIQKSSEDFGMARILGENDNVVRIMSIHKSKGLEFPIVIIAGMGKQFNRRDISAPILFHKDMGIGPSYINPILRTHNDTIARIAMKQQILLESLAEEMRILYVACTRARDKLIMVGSLNGLEKKISNWSREINSFSLAQANSYLDWVGPVVMRHPDGKTLRDLSENKIAEEELWLDKSSWKLNLVTRYDLKVDLKREEFTKDIEKRIREAKANQRSIQHDSIWEKLDWEYSYWETVNIPAKLSVTQIKNMITNGSEWRGINIPPLLEGRITSSEMEVESAPSLSGTEKGTIMHSVMQHLDFKRVSDYNEIEEQIIHMVNNELLSSVEADHVDITKIQQFFRSALGLRVLAARAVYREVPFNMLCKANELLPELYTRDDELLVQGIIDLYFEEDDEFVLVDFKTDYITPQEYYSFQGIKDKYGIQLELYKQALERIQDKPVKESYLYMFAIGQEMLVKSRPATV